MIWNLQAKGCGVQSDSRARIPPAYAQQRPQVQLRHGFTSYFSGYPGGGLERHQPRAFAFAATEINVGSTSPNFPMPG